MELYGARTGLGSLTARIAFDDHSIILTASLTVRGSAEPMRFDDHSIIFNGLSLRLFSNPLRLIAKLVSELRWRLTR